MLRYESARQDYIQYLRVREFLMSHKKKNSNASLGMSVAEVLTPGGDFSTKAQKQFSSEERQSIKNFLSKLELGDLCFSDLIEYAFALFGETKAGKTTLAHYLVNNPLEVRQTSDKPAYALDGNYKPKRLGEAIIGMTRESETVIPNSCELDEIKVNDKKCFLLDCPGYSDSKGPYLIITNAYFHYRVFSKVQSLKFIITFDFGFMTMTGSQERPIRTLENFYKSFSNFQAIKESIFKATVFFFTKVSAEREKNIKQNLEVLKETVLRQNHSRSRLIGELIEHVINGQKYFCFNQAEAGKKAYSGQQLKVIHSKTEWWTRPLSKQGNEVDMRQIQFCLGKDIMKKQAVKQQQNQENDFHTKFDILCTESANRFQNAFGGWASKDQSSFTLKNILLNFLMSSISGQASSCEFSDKLIKFVKEFYIYGDLPEQSGQRKNYYKEKRQKLKANILNYKTSVETYTIDWIQRLQVTKLLIEFLRNFYFLTEVKNKRSLQYFNEISKQIMKIISQFKKIKFFKGNSLLQSNYVSLIENFCYIIYRLLEEAKIFKIIFAYEDQQSGDNAYYITYPDKTTIIFDLLVNLISEIPEFINPKDPNIFERNKFAYIISYFKIKPNQAILYYNQVYQYCESAQPGNQGKDQNSLYSLLTQINNAKINSNLIKLDVNNTISTLLENVKLSKQNLLLKNSIQNEEIYIENMNELADEIVNLSIKMKNSSHIIRQNSLAQLKQLSPKKVSSSNKIEQKRKIQEEKKKAQNQQIIAQNCLAQKYLQCAINLYKPVGNVFKAIETYKLLMARFNEKDNPLELKDLLIEFAEYAVAHGRKELAIEKLQHAYFLLDVIHKKQYERADYESKKMKREKLAQKIGFYGLVNRHDPSFVYYDQMLTKKFSILIEDEKITELQKLFNQKK